MNKVRWGVMGTADIARQSTIPGMKQAENCTLYAIAGRRLEKARAYQEAFGFEKAYGSYEELLADPQVEAVYIPLPNSLHCQWAIRAMRAKKHVLCEKPLAVSAAQAEEMIRVSRKNGVILMEAFAYLHSPFVQAVKAELDSGVIGEIRYMESVFIGGARPDTDIRMRRETFGGAMYDLGCYTSSMALWMMGREPVDVRATAQFSPAGIDLFTSAILTYEDGTVVNLNCGMPQAGGRVDRFRAGGTKGALYSDVYFNQRGETAYTIALQDGRETKTVFAPDNYQLEVEQMGRCILEGESPRVSNEFSLMNARLIDRILAAAGYR